LSDSQDLNAKSRQSGELGPDGEPLDGGEYDEGFYSRSGKSRKSGFSRDSPYKDGGRSARIKSVLSEKDPDFVDVVGNKP